MKIEEFAKKVDLDEVAHNEPPHLDLHCLPFLSSNSPCEIALMKHIFKFCWLKIRHLLFKVLHGVLRNKLKTVSAESAGTQM